MGVVREFLSKSIAGGLSAGVVLLWWPVLFEDVDTVTSWFVRGVAWTVCFELLLRCAGSVRARALGDRARRADRAQGRQRRRAASLGLAPPPHEPAERRGHHGPRRAGGAARGRAPRAARPPAPRHRRSRPIKVVRVTKVVRPVTVKRVVERAPISGQPVITTPRAAPRRPRCRRARRRSPSSVRAAPSWDDTAPVERQSAPTEPDVGETSPPAQAPRCLKRRV